MAYKKKSLTTDTPPPVNMPMLTSGDGKVDDFCDMIEKSLTKMEGMSEMDTSIKRFIPFGNCKQLDYIVSNRSEGGAPEGRIIEIQGPPSIGKSHLMYELVKGAQSLGGLCFYFDAEQAVNEEYVVDTFQLNPKRFVVKREECLEKVFSKTEYIIHQARSLNKDIPILIVWDSLAAMTPKEELEGDYEKSTIGLAARVVSKGLRKICGVIAKNNITLVIVNQQRMKIGCISPETIIEYRQVEQKTQVDV